MLVLDICLEEDDVVIEYDEITTTHTEIEYEDANEETNQPTILAEPIFKCIDCVICLTNISNVLVCDCGHICICSECDILKCLDACPICRAKSTIKRIIE